MHPHVAVILVLLPVAILAEYMQCPHECRCTDIIAKHAPHNWRMMMSERRLHRLMFGPGRRYFGRKMAESHANNGRQMTCLGLLSMPTYIPPDIKKLCIYGEVENDKRDSSSAADAGYQRDSPFSRAFNRIRPIDGAPARQLTAIDKTKFMAARAITQLALEGNRIKSLHPMQFESLGELTELSLRNNRLKSLAKEAFMSLVDLQKLDLTENHIKRISSGVFSYTPKLRELKMRTNRLSTLPRDIFRNLRQLEFLDLSDNKMTSLPRGLFDSLYSLKELHLSNNALNDINPGLFYSLSRLSKLSLNGNQLSALPSTVFRPLSQLTQLDLTENKLTSISSNLFDRLSRMNYLVLSNNKIQHIEDGTFRNLTSLVELSLDNNAIRRLEHQMFWGLRNLLRLRLQHNEIAEIDNEIIKEMTQLQAIDLSHNRIPRISKRTFKGLLQLREIKLHNNEIKYLDDEAFGVSLLNSQSKVTWIYLQYNKIRYVKARVFYGLPWLKFVNIGHNKIRNIHQKAFSYARNINSLILNNNEIPSIEVGTFKILERLRMLNLAHNDLTELPLHIFMGLENLENINLEFNQINKMADDAFMDTPNLRSIDLTGNRLQSVDMRTFESMAKLRHLEFSKNEITHVEKPTFYQGLLKYLSFSDNRLYNLDGNITNTLSFGGLLEIHGNPWLCDCHLQWLPKLAKQGYIGLPQDDEITCKQPENLMGKQVTQLAAAAMPCLDRYTYRRLTTMMEASFMRRVCNVAPGHVATLTSKRPSLPRKELAHWHVTFVSNRNGAAICNGVVIDQDWVLITATCWRRSTENFGDNRNISIILGEEFRNLQPWKRRTPDIAVLHPHYTRVDGPNDLALVRLKALEPGVTSLLTRFPCMLDKSLQDSVLSHRRRGRVSSRLIKKTRIKIRSKSVKVRSSSDLINSTVRKLTSSYDAYGAPLYFDLGEAGWVLAGIKNAVVDSGSASHQFIPVGAHASWIDKVLSGRHR